MNRNIIWVILIFSLLGACTKKENQTFNFDYSGLPDPEIPSDNQLTRDGVELGRKLFYEKLLSRDTSISCASCHIQDFAFSDTSRFSIGVDGKIGKRQSMAIFNMAWNDNDFFWDGRAHLLRDQVLMPIQDPLEMDETLDNVIARLKSIEEYNNGFEEVFNEPGIDETKLSLALEQFVHSIVSNKSKYDLFLKNKVSLTASEERGRKLYFSNFDQQNPAKPFSNCSLCHGGLNFENDGYENNGLDANDSWTDLGRGEVINSTHKIGAFKVPSLRNIALTPPYMHDGRFETLEEVLDHYSEGIQPSSTVSHTLLSTSIHSPILDDQEKKDLIAFLKTLTDYELLNNPNYADPF